MKLIHALDEFYYEQILKSLREMNHKKVYGNLSYNSLLYMEVILYNENCTASFLADTLHVARSAVTVKVNELVSKGIVTKTPSVTDKRVNYLNVTPKIVEDYKRMDHSLTQAIAEIEDRFSSAEISSFVDMLGIIRKYY
ncbi:MarR family winged helix-turn-helix transcriptional regulator [Sporosarcina sp. D27]|uniref:MarR family winged helix-turn-helix transcriptional regulator n=1 Tax=Sporosarcina sp. D27 TaxID=1382305 RepID=UPI00047037B4|nr:MarR family transcriptional regulator [Sporosarcina sp. D27]